MRPKERIPEVLKELGEIWVRNPDLRLSQLILNLHLDNSLLYHMEDATLMEKLQKLYGKELK